MTWTAPITKAVGDPIVVSDFNTYVRDNTNALSQALQVRSVNTTFVTGPTTLCLVGRTNIAYVSGVGGLIYGYPGATFPTGTIIFLASIEGLVSTVGFLSATATTVTFIIYTSPSVEASSATYVMDWIAIGY